MPNFNSLGIDYKAVLKGSHNIRRLVGQVKSISPKDGSRQVACVKLSLDPRLLKYWNVKRHFRAMDVNSSSGVGDIVEISQLEKPHGHLISHRVEEVLFKNGAVIDPITGKPCHGTIYAEEIVNDNLQKYMDNQKHSQVETEV